MVATRYRRRPARQLLLAAAVALVAGPAPAGVLPEDRADVLYHYYDGGGVQVDGPSVLVRKQVGQSFSFSANYYVDTVSSASIDVLTTASPYDEERTQTSVGVDFLRGDTMLSVGFSNSDENDYTADTLNLGIAQEIFGGLTTISLGYGRGSDEVRRNGDDLFRDDVDRRNYRLGVSQVMTRNLLVALNYETITDEGFLNNPYRSVRYADPGNGSGYGFQPEIYPRTRTSNAVALRGRYYLPYRAAVHGSYRYFTDDWDIDAHTAEIGYTHPRGPWSLDLAYRFYSQGAADFYSDLFPFENSQNFMARDKELSTFTSHTLRFGISFDFLEGGWRFLDRGRANLLYDHIMFDYEDFRDLTAGGTPGQEPLYSLDADVVQLFFSFWF